MSALQASLPTMLSLAFLLLSSAVFAKRVAPKEVTVVERDGIEYSAPTDQKGFVVAKDKASGTILWSRQVYVIWFDLSLEKDVQDCFVTSLAFSGAELVIRNEAGHDYRLNLETLEVSGAPQVISRKK